MFASGDVKIYTVRPEIFGNYPVTAKGQELPELTNIVTTMIAGTGTHSLSAPQISKLRGASGGELRLVIYEDELAVLSPATKKALKKARDNDAFVEVLRARREESITYTRNILNSR